MDLFCCIVHVFVAEAGYLIFSSLCVFWVMLAGDGGLGIMSLIIPDANSTRCKNFTMI